MGSESRAGGAPEFDSFGSAVKVERHAHLMGTTCRRRQVGHRDIVAVTELDDIRLYTQRNDKSVSILGSEYATVPNATDNGAFADIRTKIHLLEFPLTAVEDIRRDECTGIFRVAIQWQKGAKVGREFHRKATDAHNETLVWFVEMVGCKAEIHLLTEADDSRTEINLADLATARLVLGLINEAFPRVNHVSERELTPIEGLLEIGRFKASLDGEFAADGLLVTVDSTDSRRAEGASARTVVHHDEAETTRNTGNVLVICRSGCHIVSTHGRPLVPVVHDEPGTARSTCKRRVEVDGVRVELREFRVLGRRRLRRERANAREHEGQCGQSKRIARARKERLGELHGHAVSQDKFPV